MSPQLVHNQRKCTRCGTCVRICPVEANRLEGDTLHVDFTRCRSCGLCVPYCPADARSIAGRRYTIDELFAEVQKDMPFYRRNEGGVTLSGGEVLMQSRFASEFLQVCKEHFIHTAIETSGYAAWSSLESLARHCDLVFVDLKMMDSQRHKACTGVGNARIVHNIRRLCAYSQERGLPRVVIRRLIIEGLTDDDETTVETARFINSLPTRPEINLLPFHNLGEAKYSMIGLPYLLQGRKTMKEKDPAMLHVRDLTARYAPECRVSIGGGNI